MLLCGPFFLFWLVDIGTSFGRKDWTSKFRLGYRNHKYQFTAIEDLLFAKNACFPIYHWVPQRRGSYHLFDFEISLNSSQNDKTSKFYPNGLGMGAPSKSRGDGKVEQNWNWNVPVWRSFYGHSRSPWVH